MRLPHRVMKLEEARRHSPERRNLSTLTDEELRLLASLPGGDDDLLDLSGLDPARLRQVEEIVAKIEASS